MSITRYFTYNSYINIFTFASIGISTAVFYKLDAKYLGIWLIIQQPMGSIGLWISTYFYGKYRLYLMILISLVGDIFLIFSVYLLNAHKYNMATQILFWIGNYHIIIYSMIRYEKQRLMRLVSDNDFKYLKKLEERCKVVGITVGSIIAMLFYKGKTIIPHNIFFWLLCFEIVNFLFAFLQCYFAFRIRKK